MQRERMTAVRASISDIVNGNYGDDTGPHVVSPFGVELRRVVVVGFVVNKFYRDGDDSGKRRFESITLDDGTDTIRVKVWGDEDAAMLEGVKENILALVIGKVRKYEDEAYIVPEIVRELTDPNYMSLHLMERYKTILTRSGVTLQSTDEHEQEVLASDSSTPVSGKLANDILAYVRLEAPPEGIPLKDIKTYFEKKGQDPEKVEIKVFNLVAEGALNEISIGQFRTPDV
ncbi:MAG: OB-fold nucleic acid binding domain-containing protein [Candidatus Thorarchaeota archaeon]